MNIVSRAALPLAFAIAFSGCSQAQEAQTSGVGGYTENSSNRETCNETETQAGMTECTAGEYEKLDKYMADLYFSLPKSQELLTSQRAWLAYRDAHCQYAHHSTPDGSMYGMETALCKSDLTRQRIDTLRDAKEEQYGATY